MINFFERKESKNCINLILNFLFIFYAGTFIIESGLHRFIIYLTSLLWLIEGNFKDKFSQIFRQKVVLYYLSIIILFLISLTFFSDTVTNGIWMQKYENGYDYLLSKHFQYFVIAIYIATSLRKEFIKYMLIAFILQVCYLSFNSFLIYFQKDDYDVIIFIVHHIIFSVVLLFAINILFYSYVQSKTKYIKIIYVLLITMFTLNIFILGSRSGYLNILLIFTYVLFFYLKYYRAYELKSIFKTMLGFLLFIIVLLGLMYYNIDNFKKRIDIAVEDLQKVESKSNYSTSLGVRIGFNIINSQLLFSDYKNFIFGYGMGDVKSTLKNYIEKTDTNKLPILHYYHVHNQYYQTWIDGGILALILYLLIFYKLTKLKFDIKEKLFVHLYVIIFLIYGISDVIYNGAKVMGLFSLFLGIILAIEKKNQQNNKKIINRD